MSLKKPYGNPVVQGFDDLTPTVFDISEESPGFIARAKQIDDKKDSCNFNRDWGEWGVFEVPDHYDLGRNDDNDQRASTLSLWTDLTALKKFVFSGLHLSALKKRYDWFQKIRYPNYAIWWVGADHVPTWNESVQRLDSLHKAGPTSYAFDFICPFDSNGEKTKIN